MVLVPLSGQEIGQSLLLWRRLDFPLHLGSDGLPRTRPSAVILGAGGLAASAPGQVLV